MHLGVTLRNMGAQSTPETLLRCAALAEEAGLESIWVVDHIAIPPDDAEGSGGRYVDPLVTLAWLAGATQRIRLGVGVLILPYRSALPTAKQIASVQELSGERLILGVGVGWMPEEFKALGMDRSKRGRTTDATLDLLNRCFEDDQVVQNGQPFLFKPRPAKPPVLIGGGAAARPAPRGPLRRWLAAYGAAPGQARGAFGNVSPALRGRWPRRRPGHGDGCAAFARPNGRRPNCCRAYQEAGAERFVHGGRYRDAAEFGERVELLRGLALD